MTDLVKHNQTSSGTNGQEGTYRIPVCPWCRGSMRLDEAAPPDIQPSYKGSDVDVTLNFRCNQCNRTGQSVLTMDKAALDEMSLPPPRLEAGHAGHSNAPGETSTTSQYRATEVTVHPPALPPGRPDAPHRGRGDNRPALERQPITARYELLD